MENDLFQLWRLVAELWDQLAQNRALTASLQAQAGSIKSTASHQETGFALRRFNMHMTQEAYESELERMNAAFIQQNFELQNDNKQLAVLLKEYEQTLETVMSKFRTHAHTSQQHELSMTRHYESLLLSRETSFLSSDLLVSTAYSHTLARMSHLLRTALRVCGGEPPEELANEARDADEYVEGAAMDDWALERESELVRLEYENYELRRMIGIPPPLSLLSPPSPSPDVQTRIEATLEGDQRHYSLAMSGDSLSQVPEDGLALPRQQSHTQAEMQISLDGSLPSPSQTLRIPSSSEAPLITRKYVRRASSESGSFIGDESFPNPSLDGDLSTNSSTEPVGTSMSASGSGVRPMSVILGSGERSMDILPSGHRQDDELSTSGPEQDMRDGR